MVDNQGVNKGYCTLQASPQSALIDPLEGWTIEEDGQTFYAFV
jgi:hypothetical protein